MRQRGDSRRDMRQRYCRMGPSVPGVLKTMEVSYWCLDAALVTAIRAAAVAATRLIEAQYVYGDMFRVKISITPAVILVADTEKDATSRDAKLEL